MHGGELLRLRQRRTPKTHALRFRHGDALRLSLPDELPLRLSHIGQELKNDIRAKALETAQKQVDSAFEQAAVDKAAENVTVDMPKGLVEAELDNQMERFAYQLQMSGYSMDQYAKMMGGDVSTMRNAFRPTAEKQAKVNVMLEKIVEVEGISATDEEIEAEYQELATNYQLELAKVKEMVPVEEIKSGLTTRKAIKVIVDNAVAVAPKAQEKTEE